MGIRYQIVSPADTETQLSEIIALEVKFLRRGRGSIRTQNALKFSGLLRACSWSVVAIS